MLEKKGKIKKVEIFSTFKTSNAAFFSDTTKAVLSNINMFAKMLVIVWDLPVPGGPIIIVLLSNAEKIAFSCEKSVWQILKILFLIHHLNNHEQWH